MANTMKLVRPTAVKGPTVRVALILVKKQGDCDDLQEGSKKTEGAKKKINKEQGQIGMKNQGHWTSQEHQIYVEFLEQHHSTSMQSQQNRKNNKIFKLMSLTIGTRSPSQCRSHHQKFNPYTAAGQKRNKRNRRRMGNQNADGEILLNMTAKPVVQYNTPTVKPILDQCYDECDDYISNYEDSRPQLKNFCCNSNIDNEYGNRWDRDQYLY
ncbi:unnamed protein product (macronuclear) [Paramecium tetraurelia]|uniref:Myb-like domain-containing protein n=1 Tax=Paramecium tetraurelia TaxID=5888 RepID=A0BW44_PARTE|nr:uncharacterized protein GSPATT00032613001 [Paramecium tetraurelia]CAK62761.1 unnamed protein product [Paramecium tetraurelia]|eukprot:XP_001430159.1 hypothetical protein (macronuclear) [Paramecium tetraurelia strain d4-2]